MRHDHGVLSTVSLVCPNDGQHIFSPDGLQPTAVQVSRRVGLRGREAGDGEKTSQSERPVGRQGLPDHVNGRSLPGRPKRRQGARLSVFPMGWGGEGERKGSRV